MLYDKHSWYIFLAGIVPRTYTPVAHEDDLFLPTRHMGSKEVRACNCFDGDAHTEILYLCIAALTDI
jgi:hypothetical protein